MKRILIIAALIAQGSFGAHAQDVQFVRVTALSTWYNTSLKTDQSISADLLYRNVNYDGFAAYRSAMALVNYPISVAPDKGENAGYFNLNLALVNDKMTNNYMNNTTGALGVSYAQPLGGGVFVAAGFQGAVYQNTLGLSGASFPDQFDKFGLVPSSVTRDPMRNGQNINWFSLNTGVSLFGKTGGLSWYGGLSVRDVNRPEADRDLGGAYKMPMVWGFQGGLEQQKNDDIFGCYTNVNWRAQANEYLVGIKYGRILDHSRYAPAIMFGTAYRVGDALIPHVDFRYLRTTVAVLYDVNISGINAAMYRRRGFEIALKQIF
jgi:type IX secretion system PorP/SprF family membrane protein